MTWAKDCCTGTGYRAPPEPPFTYIPYVYTELGLYLDTAYALKIPGAILSLEKRLVGLEKNGVSPDDLANLSNKIHITSPVQNRIAQHMADIAGLDMPGNNATTTISLQRLSRLVQGYFTLQKANSLLGAKVDAIIQDKQVKASGAQKSNTTAMPKPSTSYSTTKKNTGTASNPFSAPATLPKPMIPTIPIISITRT
ncbi:hypothetical protein LTR66_016399, partial [Elasticomyces elasticus]